MKRSGKFNLFFHQRITPSVRLVLSLADGVVYFMSFIFLLTTIYKYGFPLVDKDLVNVTKIYRMVWLTFLTVNTGHLLFDWQEVRQHYHKITWLLGAMLYLTLIPVILKGTGWVEYVSFLQSSIYKEVLLALLSILYLSNGFIRLLGKRTHPSLILASSFLVLIVVGTGLLLLPKSTYQGISVVDALFTSTSAVCVTGLTTVSVPTVFTPFGEFVILILIQIGGLGVMTITSFFAMSFMGNTSIYSQLVVKDMINSESLNSLFSTLIYILLFTLCIEAVGAFLIYWDVHGTLDMTLSEEIFFAIFHAVSAFCNAGFSTLSDNLGNGMLMHNHNLFYWSISVLVILGGIGYPILVNFYQILKYEMKTLYQKVVHRQRMPRKIHLYNLNTRIVLFTTAFLLILGTSFILVVEWKRAFGELPVLDKVTHAFFNAVSPRTAGFNSVSLSSMEIQTLLIYIMLMVIGGSSQSSAGGVKVNTIAVVFLNLRAVLANRQTVTVYHRTLSMDSIRRSNATLIFYLLIVFVCFFLMTLLEPDLPPFALLFECVSALSTVGSSLDLTPRLGGVSKCLLMVLMFIGRVGLLTFVASLVRKPNVQKYQYPSDQIIIN